MKITDLKIVALLPMKAHSERVRNKNFRVFNGKPLFRWVLDTLLSLDRINEVIINTDARQILSEKGFSDSARIKIRDRKSELCGNLVSMNRIIEDDISNVSSEVYIMTHTTNPLLSVQTISNALDVFINKSNNGLYDSLFSVSRFQTRFYYEDAKPVNHDPDNLIRTQDLVPFFEENSNLYIFTAESFAKTKSRIGKNPILFETPRFESVDIDDQESWELAEIISKSKNNTN